MTSPVVMFVEGVDLTKVKIPDDSLLVGFDQRPLDRVPEWVIGPEGTTIHQIWKPDYLVGMTCPQCQDRREKPGYIFQPDGSSFIGVFSCLNCGLVVFPEWLRGIPAKEVIEREVRENEKRSL